MSMSSRWFRSAGLLALGAGVPLLAQEGPKLSFNLFGDLRYVAQDTSRPPGGPAGRSHAGLGQFDFMTQGRLDDHWSAFVEAVLEYDPDAHETVVDLERFYVEYQAEDALTLGLGKRHTPMGYWNNAYHHGMVFQPTIDRPLLTEFEDGGGLQPAHDTGLWARGRSGTAGWFGYDVMLSNGQTGSQASDGNAHKALTVHLEGKAAPFALGVTYRSDLLAPNTALNARPGTVSLETEVTYTGLDARVEHPRVQALGEYLQVKEKDSAGEATTKAWFLYVGVPLGAWTPYALVQDAKVDAATRLFAGFVDSQRSQSLGLRYQFEAPVVAKLEAARTTYPATDRSERRITFALAFGF